MFIKQFASPRLRFIEGEGDGAGSAEVDDAASPDDVPDGADDQLGEGGKRALIAEREANKVLKKQIADIQAKLDAAAAPKPADDMATAIADLQSKLAAEIAARQDADARVEAAELAQKRGDRASAKGLPMALAKKLTGATDAEIDAEIDELLPLLAPRGVPRPNPYQGVPSEGSGGTLSAGRERYAQQHK
jgi:hypothetical protein